MAAPPQQLTKDYGKLVITLASTGNLNTKERNPSLPCTPKEMADDLHECAKLGVSVFHMHSRDENNKPPMRPEIFQETCRLVKERDPDVIIQISTGGRAKKTDGTTDHTWRSAPLDLLPEMGSFTPGTVNLNPIVYENSPELVQHLGEKYRDTGIKPQVRLAWRARRPRPANRASAQLGSRVRAVYAKRVRAL
jgi:3-keto-5-aminohexanoate cleavage enzyme